MVDALGVRVRVREAGRLADRGHTAAGDEDAAAGDRVLVPGERDEEGRGVEGRHHRERRSGRPSSAGGRARRPSTAAASSVRA